MHAGNYGILTAGTITKRETETERQRDRERERERERERSGCREEALSFFGSCSVSFWSILLLSVNKDRIAKV